MLVLKTTIQLYVLEEVIMGDLSIFGMTQTVHVHQQIKATLDQGNVDYFGMTAGL